MTRISRLTNAAGVALLAGALAFSFPGVSSAVFSAKSQSTGTVAAAGDWTPPTVALTAPSAFVRGTVALTGTAADTRSGLAKVDLQLSGGSGWSALGSATTSPYSVAWNTTTRADGPVSLRAVAYDKAYAAAAPADQPRHTATSTTVQTTIDNTAPTVTMTDPGAILKTRTTLSSSVADATSGVARVVYQYAPTGTQNFQPLATAVASPWSVALPASLADGRYDLRAVAIDRAGNERASGTVVDRVVDNGPALAGLDIQIENGGATVGRPEVGDRVVYTFNRVVDTTSILGGWNGAATEVSVNLNNPLFQNNDSLQVAGSSLGTVYLKQDYVGGLGLDFGATMTAGTVTGPDGRPRTVVTVRFDTVTWGFSLGANTVTRADTLTWNPSTSVLDLLGNRSAATAVTESGPLDREF